MDKNALWDKFMRTGKVSDYLSYRRAERSSGEEFSDELYPENPNGEDCDYDNENEWYSNP